MSMLAVFAAALSLNGAPQANAPDVDWLTGHWLACDGDVAERLTWIPDNSSINGTATALAPATVDSRRTYRIRLTYGPVVLQAHVQGGATETYNLAEHGRNFIEFEGWVGGDQYRRVIRFERVGDTLTMTGERLVGEMQPPTIIEYRRATVGAACPA